MVMDTDTTMTDMAVDVLQEPIDHDAQRENVLPDVGLYRFINRSMTILNKEN